MSKFIKLRVRDTENILFEGDVERISSYNEVGPFDVLPMHANFISILLKQITLYHNKVKIKEMPIEQAVLKVKGDEVHIFLGIEAFSLDEQQLSTPSSSTK